MKKRLLGLDRERSKGSDGVLKELPESTYLGKLIRQLYKDE